MALMQVELLRVLMRAILSNDHAAAIYVAIAGICCTCVSEA